MFRLEEEAIIWPLSIDINGIVVQSFELPNSTSHGMVQERLFPR